MNLNYFTLLFFLIILYSMPAQAQVSQDETFGKNRVQYHKDFKYWWQYETPHFLTYWASPARKNAEAAILFAEKDYREIRSLLEHHINDKIQIIVFRDLTDFKQSNLGTEEIVLMEEGQTKIDGNRIFVYFDGDHKKLRHQIREGIASVHIAQMLQGRTIQEIVQNAFYSSLPEWYITGLISYIGSPYDYQFENDIRGFFNEYEVEDFEDFARKKPVLAGHALWNFIYARYGATKLSNLLYITRINRRLDDGFIYVLGVPFSQVSRECLAFIKEAYVEQSKYFVDPKLEEIPIKKKKISKKNRNKFNLTITDVQLSPDGKKLIYVTNEIGKYRAWLYDMESGKQEQIMKGSFRNPFQTPDFNYPKFAWGTNSNQLISVFEKRDKVYLKEWDLEKEESRIQVFPPDVERIYSLSVYSRDTILLSASTDGYADLYFYRPKTRSYKRLTHDYFDDLDAQPVEVGGAKYIVFSSNRLNNSLERQDLDTIPPAEEFDLFVLSPKTNLLQRITSTARASERQPILAGSEVFYISDENGIQNRWKMDLAGDELNASMLSQYKNGIVHFSTNENVGVENVEIGGNPILRIFSPEQKAVDQIHYTILADFRKQDEQKNQPNLVELPETEKKSSQEKMYYFQSEFEEEIPLPPDFNSNVEADKVSLLIIPDFSDLVNKKESESRVEPFNSARMLAYRMTFGLTDFDIDLNNDVLFTGLNSYAGFKRGFEFPPMGIMANVESRDIFENYIVSGGVRIPLTFNGTEFFLAIEDRKFQLDKKLSFYRSSNKTRDDRRFEGFDTRNSIHMGVLELKYPLSIFSSLRLATTLRLDRTIFLADIPSELNEDNLTQQRIGLRLEYVFDNSYETRMNIRNGSRAKIYVEGVNRFQVQIDPWTFDASQAFMTVVGIDARHYIRLDRYSIFAMRFAGATSFGSEKILHYLGGVRNWLSPQYNNSIPFPTSDNFAYQAGAFEMRGFKQNIRNGASYLLGNTELRIPFFNYFFRNEIRSNFFRNFQIIGFFDAGTAWHGSSPTSEENTLNTEFIDNPTSSVKVTYYRDPLVLGYGAGVRLNMLGYFVRLDYAWGYESRQRTDRIFYVSLGYDF